MKLSCDKCNKGFYSRCLHKLEQPNYLCRECENDLFLKKEIERLTEVK
jgi:hypothetical protein